MKIEIQAENFGIIRQRIQFAMEHSKDGVILDSEKGEFCILNNSKQEIVNDNMFDNSELSNQGNKRKFEKEIGLTVEETAEVLAAIFGMTKEEAKEMLFKLMGV